MIICRTKSETLILFNELPSHYRGKSNTMLVYFLTVWTAYRLNLICCGSFPLDLDPCIDVTCHYHSHCEAFGPHDARCVCVNSCPSYKEPVCSSNGTTYDNKCLFEQEICLHRLNFTMQHPGSCEGWHHYFKTL